MHRLPIALVLLLLAPLASAQVYKWTDASGTVHYSEAPPSQGTRFTRVTTTGTVQPLAKPSTPAAETSDRTEGGSNEGNGAQKVADTPANRKTLCASLQSNLTTLQGSGPVVLQKDGKATALDAAQRKQQISTAQAQYNQYCQDK